MRKRNFDTPSVILASGTVLLVEGVKVTLLDNVRVTFPNCEQESTYTSFLAMTGKEQTPEGLISNLTKNSHLLPFKVSPEGVRLGLDDQPDYASGQSLEDFILTLSRSEAIEFNCEAQWEALNIAEEAKAAEFAKRVAEEESARLLAQKQEDEAAKIEQAKRELESWKTQASEDESKQESKAEESKAEESKAEESKAKGKK